MAKTAAMMTTTTMAMVMATAATAMAMTAVGTANTVTDTTHGHLLSITLHLLGGYTVDTFTSPKYLVYHLLY